MSIGYGYFARRKGKPMKLKPVFTREGWRIRLFRLMWKRGTVGDGHGYSCMFSVGLYPRVFAICRKQDSWRLWLFGLRLHFERDFGGIHV